MLGARKLRDATYLTILGGTGCCSMYRTVRKVKTPLESDHKVDSLPAEVLGLFIEGRPICKKDLTSSQKQMEVPPVLVPGVHRCTKCKRLIR